MGAAHDIANDFISSAENASLTGPARFVGWRTERGFFLIYLSRLQSGSKKAFWISAPFAAITQPCRPAQKFDFREKAMNRPQHLGERRYDAPGQPVFRSAVTNHATFAVRNSFTLQTHCPVVATEVKLSGLHLILADGSTELVKKTCANFSTCYRGQETENLTAIRGCLLGNVAL